MLFNDLSLDGKLLKAVSAMGFTTPTPIQEKAIPVILDRRDLMASAQTGTGKTAAFVLPILNHLLTPSQNPGNGPRVLVLTPTRELATQVNDDIRNLGRFCQFTAGSIVGGLGYGPQISMLRRPLDLLVATPGRLLDHMSESRVDFSRLEVFVLDEADRMLDMGFIGDVRKIASKLPAKRQTLLFSATLEGKVRTIANELTRDAACVQLAANAQRHEDITQHVYQADDSDHKHRLLVHHLSSQGLTQALVFTRTKRRADRLAARLTREGGQCAALHGGMAQPARRRTIDRMRTGQLRVLVATDVAARGLDIQGISHVINFDLPMVPEDYIHRIGRTGRAGSTGTAVSFVGPEDRPLLVGIKRLTGWEMPRETVPGLEPVLKVSERSFQPDNNRSRQGKGPRNGAPGRGGSKPQRSRSRPGQSRRPSRAARPGVRG